MPLEEPNRPSVVFWGIHFFACLFSSIYNWEEAFSNFFWPFQEASQPHQSDKVSSSARAVALWKMKGRLLIVAIAAFRVVAAVDVAALVSNTGPITCKKSSLV